MLKLLSGVAALGMLFAVGFTGPALAGSKAPSAYQQDDEFSSWHRGYRHRYRYRYRYGYYGPRYGYYPYPYYGYYRPRPLVGFGVGPVGVGVGWW